IDDQVHFREPGLTHKANIYTESRAAVAGGTTSFMEMPNTNPPAFTRELLEQKYEIASRTSLANYSFFMGTSNDNLEEIERVDPTKVCGVKIFMGSSTGNLLVDNPTTLDHIFANCPTLIATHCEDERRINERLAMFQEKYGDQIPFSAHPLIRDEEVCFNSSRLACDLAKKHNSRLHILHITTEEEIALFSNKLPLEQKRITAEVCVHHLWYDSDDYEQLGSQIKCNPAVKAPRHKPKLLEALKNNTFDIIASDHAPHTWEEKQQGYLKAPSGLPLVQHTLTMMLEFYHQGKISKEQIVEKMCHAPAICFRLENRGFIREGYAADLVLLDLNKASTVDKSNIFYKCGWSPLEGQTFQSSINSTFVNGNLVFKDGLFFDENCGERLLFRPL
ncbi:MAG: dihydroorotase, partial [Chitinophagales bacterium]|nr:dihydroorotase [Chitinophagales bacterium]